jgi:diacylglycerol kinase
MDRVARFYPEGSTKLCTCSYDVLVMPALDTSTRATFLMQIFTAAFLAILFLQSGIDKVIDRRGNLEWLSGHFAKSPLAGVVPALLTIITILELGAGVSNGVGCVTLILLRDSTLAFYGAVFSAVAILALFFGQRMAKDYPGAAVLVPYFLLALVAIYLLAQR